ncbi:MAG: hypothetical protein FWG20_01690 [Candidatus Cloacimonetes bacterium]|nr:hypothetical protein [Candidatus Cloacimonadota bacterium]
MRSKIMIWCTLVLLVVIGCNRFDKDFKEYQTVAEFEEAFIEAANTGLKSNNNSFIKEYYAQRYYNKEIGNSSIFDIYSQEAWSENVALTMQETSHYEYSLTLTDTDFEYTWEDRIARNGYKYEWRGIPDDSPNLVIAQSLTFLTCTYCPTAKLKLMEILDDYPSQFLYLSYHSDEDDPFSIYNKFEFERDYWHRPVAPYVMFQGRNGYQGAGSSNLNRYRQDVETFIEETFELEISWLEGAIYDSQTISGLLTVSFTTLNQDNLYLFYVVYEKETEHTYLYNQGVHASNVVRGRGYHRLDSITSGRDIHFTFESVEILNDVSENYLVVWIQRIADLQNHQAGDKILNAKQKKLYNSNPTPRQNGERGRSPLQQERGKELSFTN